MVYCTFLQHLIVSGKVRVFHLLRTPDRNDVKMPCSAEYAQCSHIRPVVEMKLLGLATTTALFFSLLARQPPSGPWPPHSRGSFF